MELKFYDPMWGAVVAGWVRSDEDAHWLAPGTVPPVTAQKVTAWKKPGGASLLGFMDLSPNPSAYGELNPMQSDPGHFWIGHVIVDPALRGHGIGSQFVRGVLQEAFARRRARRVSLVVFPDNVAAVRCYRHCGFHVVGMEYHRFLPSGPRHRLLRLEAASASVDSNSLPSLATALAG